MYIYAFGSICRGEVTPESDIDLLAIVDGVDERFDPNIYSIYSKKRLNELWQNGNPFAWHLSIESKLLFSENGNDYIHSLGNPNKYESSLSDCNKFYQLFEDAKRSFFTKKSTVIFDLSTMFLGIRNFSTCFSLGITNKPDFSRNSALHLGDRSVPVTKEAYNILARARILCTRGQGRVITDEEVQLAANELPAISLWMERLLTEVSNHGSRIQ